LVVALVIGTLAVTFAQARDIEGCYAHSPAAVAGSNIGNPWERTVEIPVSVIQRGRRTMAERETGSLIGSDKVEGTAVYGADRQEIGSIERVMIDKVSGKVSYAVLSFGGFLGIGDDHYPLPWQSLKYDTALGGYVTTVDKAKIEGAPKYANDDSWNWADTQRTRSVNDYYGVPYV
jgi:hypothetical protein